MALGPIHCGSFLLFAAMALLIVASISAPVYHQISFLDIKDGSSTSTFGVFGYCTSASSCSARKLGYDIASISGEVSSWTYVNNHLQTLTKALILHPIAAGLAFLAFLVAACSDRLGFIFSALIAFLAFIVSLVAMIIDFVMFGIIRHEINDNTTSSASYGNATWLVLAATVILFFSTFVVCFETCTHHRRNRASDREVGYAQGGYVGNQQMVGTAPAGATTGTYGKRHWWSRNKYAY